MKDMVYGLWYMAGLLWKPALFCLRDRNRVALPYPCRFVAFLRSRDFGGKTVLDDYGSFRLGGGVSTSLQELLCGYIMEDCRITAATVE